MNAEHLLTHFDRLADAPDAIPRLRRFILDLAVRGRLVEQDPNDEPAEALSQRAKTAKTRIMVERKIGSNIKPELSVSAGEDTSPARWVWTHLYDFALVLGGKRLPVGATFSANATKNIYIRVSDMKDQSISTDDLKYISDEVRAQIAKYTIERTDLYITIAGTIGNVGEVPEQFHGQNLTENAAKIVFREIDKGFLLLVLQSADVQSQFQEKMKQMAQPKLALKRISGIRVPLPPLAEQHRIVAKVGELMALCDRLETVRKEREATRAQLATASLARLSTPSSDPAVFQNHAAFALNNLTPLTARPDQIKALRQTILNLAVRGKLVEQDPKDEPAGELLKRITAEKVRLVKAGEIRKPKKTPLIDYNSLLFGAPPGWVWARLLDISRKIHYGFTASANQQIAEVRLLRITDIQHNKVEWHSVPGCEIDEKALPSFRLEMGDILIARTGGTIGKSFLVAELPVVAVFASYLIRVQGSHEIYARYLKLFLESPIYWAQLQEGTRGAGQPNVNGQTLGTMLVPLPPLAEQHRIVAKVDELMAVCDRLEAGLAAGEETRGRLVEAVLHEALVPGLH